MRTAFCHYCHDRIALAEDGGFVYHSLRVGYACGGWGQGPLADPGEVLSVLSEHIPRSHNDAGFWILLSASVHLLGDHDSQDGSTAEALFWHTEPVSTVEGPCMEQ
jgi:hypothetical protein